MAWSLHNCRGLQDFLPLKKINEQGKVLGQRINLCQVKPYIEDASEKIDSDSEQVQSEHLDAQSIDDDQRQAENQDALYADNEITANNGKFSPEYIISSPQPNKKCECDEVKEVCA